MSFSIPFRQAPFKKLKELVKSRNPSRWQGTAEWSTTTPYPCSLAFCVGRGMPITLLLVWVWFQFSTKKSSASWWNCLFRRGIGGTEDRRCKHDIFWLLWSDFWHSELDGNNPCEVQFSYPEAPTNDTLTWKCAEYTHPFTLMHFQFHLQLKGTGRTFVLRTTQSMEESHTTQVYTNTCCIYTRFVYTAWYTFDKYIYIYSQYGLHSTGLCLL